MTIERRTFSFGGLEHPGWEARGARDGPRVSLIAGVHGCEYSSIAAVTRFVGELDASELAGVVVAVPVVSLESFRARSPFVVPADRKNLNRSFPGSADGSYTDRLAHGIFEQLVEPADALIDLHGGDLVEDLEPFTIYTASPVEERSRALAVAFGLRYVVREEGDGLTGMTIDAAAQAGVPAIIAEAGGRGILEERCVQLLADGVRNVLRSLEMLPGEVAARELRFVGGNVWLRSQHEGWWDAAVGPGVNVARGQLLGRMRNLWGDALEEVVAPADGVVLFVTSSPAVLGDGLLVGLGTDVS
jgi:predicted deacylase